MVFVRKQFILLRKKMIKGGDTRKGREKLKHEGNVAIYKYIVLYSHTI